MRLVSFRHEGRSSFGAVVDGRVVDLGERSHHRSLAAALEAGGIAELQRLAAGALPGLALDAVELLPPITDPGKIICVGLNYAPHILESGREMPKHPALFVRFPESLVGHDQPLRAPRVSERFDYEGELAFVVERRASRVAEADALAHVAGYACFNDGSVRDWQRHTGQFTAGKNFRQSGAFGPWLVTADEIPDPAALTLATRVSGEELQRARTGELVFGVPALIAYITTFIDLLPGDVVATGTPGGVGNYQEPQRFVRPGDVVEVEISGIGVLRNEVIADD
jgi:2-keto-4-pentenoate hydratase/2-oxohepta-3-ene-1,7-dioic acid hydratase in catechol pathway